jgi:hypothetical protein
MGWMDAHEYFTMEQVLNDRLDDAARFSLERTFHSEADDTAPPCPALERGCRARWAPRQSSVQHV